MSKMEEPVSPTARLLQAQQLNLSIIALIGYNTSIDVNLFKNCIRQTFLNHPRFNCLLINERGKCSWRRTKVDIDNHIIIPDLDPNMESSDQFMEDFSSDLSKIPMDMTKPLWEFYILNVKTSDAKATVIFKVHHSMGDGVSLIALIHACSRRTSDPESLPVSVVPSSRKHRYGIDKGFMKRFSAVVSTMFWIIFNTLVDCALFLATMMFMKDTKTPIKATGGGALPYKRFVHRIVSLDDVKLVKTAMNVSVNDVVVGVTEAGLSHYLNKAYEEQRENGVERSKSSTSLPRNIRLRSAVVFNLRPTPTIEDLAEMMEKEELNGMWGNRIAIVLLPFTIHLSDDPLTHIRRAKSNMDKKKLSLGHKSAFFVMKLIMMLFGTERAACATRAIFRNTTLIFSNVMGPHEEVNLLGHPMSYVAPSVYGFPQSLIVHYQSYAEKLIISIGVDEKLIPNPHQLCDDLVKSLRNIKEAVIKRGLGKGSQLG